MADSDRIDDQGHGSLLQEIAHWTGIVGQLQQLLMEHGLATVLKVGDEALEAIARQGAIEPAELLRTQSAWWQEALGAWRAMMPGQGGSKPEDPRLANARWQEPIFAVIRQTYEAIAERLISNADAMEGLDAKKKEQLLFATRSFVDAMSPANFALTNPQVLERIAETGGRNLVTGLERILSDIARGQIRHTGADAFEIGRNIAVTPGKVVHETPLYQLIHYAPATKKVREVPLLIFPPWINRFYILDLNAQKSFVRWAVEQGLSVFLVSWRSADASLAATTMDDYVLRGQQDAIEVVRDLLGVDRVHLLGYCVAGTALSMLLAWAAATGRAHHIASATFFTAQVDFSEAGDLSLFVDDAQLALVEGLATNGYLDGRYMSAAFNLLRGRDLIWNYVVNNYLLAEDYMAFDLLHWNSDVTNLPAAWHRRYLTDFYRDNLLVKAGAIEVGGVGIDLGRIETPSYVQAGREDHIAPPESVWKMTHYFAGPLRFVLAGSGHIAGVINPPSANKYGYWTNEGEAKTLADFVAGAEEHKGSWWPDWLAWISGLSGGFVRAQGGRVPGEGKLAAIEDAPGRYVRAR